MKKEKINKLLVALLITSLIVAIYTTYKYISNLSENSIQKVVEKPVEKTNNQLFSEYVSNIKKCISKFENYSNDKGSIEEKILEYINISDNKNSTQVEVYINNTQEVYIDLSNNKTNSEENNILKQLQNKYGNKYKITENAIDILKYKVSFNSPTDINDIVFILKNDGTIEYIMEKDLNNSIINTKKVTNLKNIINIKEITRQATGDIASGYTYLIAIDINGNVFEINTNQL